MIELTRDDITALEVDAILNAADQILLDGDVDEAPFTAPAARL